MSNQVTDQKVTSCLIAVAAALGLTLSRRCHGASFCTVYMEANPHMMRQEQRDILQNAKQALEAAGLGGITLGRFSNPPYRSKVTGQMEEGHPRHGDPLLEIESVWWSPPDETA